LGGPRGAPLLKCAWGPPKVGAPILCGLAGPGVGEAGPGGGEVLSLPTPSLQHHGPREEH
jgi:hypothetical protein